MSESFSAAPGAAENIFSSQRNVFGCALRRANLPLFLLKSLFPSQVNKILITCSIWNMRFLIDKGLLPRWQTPSPFLVPSRYLFIRGRSLGVKNYSTLLQREERQPSPFVQMTSSGMGEREHNRRRMLGIMVDGLIGHQQFGCRSQRFSTVLLTFTSGSRHLISRC